MHYKEKVYLIYIAKKLYIIKLGIKTVFKTFYWENEASYTLSIYIHAYTKCFTGYQILISTKSTNDKNSENIITVSQN